MKLIVSIISTLSILLIFGAYSASSQSDRIDNLENTYGIYVDKYISKLETKTDTLQNTKSPKLAQQALLSCMKINFLQTNKENLTMTLSANKVKQRPYSIQYALNKLFYNSLISEVKTDNLYSCFRCGQKIDMKTL